jgi:hypothetical protein
VGISVEPPSRNAAMAEKLDLPFSLLSDPRGELIKRVGLWSEEEGVSMPAVVLLDKSGTVRYLYSGGTDFTDRPTKNSLLEVLDRVSTDGETGERGPEVRVGAEEAETATVRPDKPAMTLEQLLPYYLGAYYATIAMQKKLEDSGPEGATSYKKVSDYQELINEYSEALQETAQA